MAPEKYFAKVGFSWAANPALNRTNRLQLKRGLFWCRHHPKMHDMGSDPSSRAENWTDPSKHSMCVFEITKIKDVTITEV